MARAYDVLEHGLMVGDQRRMDAYLDAIRRSVGPGSVVADIGSGLGIFAMAACDAGARRVFAMEPSPIGWLAKSIIAANGYASRVECIDDLSTRVTLPERADVIVMDVRGVLPDDQITVAIDARERLLAPGGRIIPARDTIWAAPIEAPDLFDRHVAAIADGLDLGSARAWILEQPAQCRVRPEQLASEPRLCAAIDYLAVTSPEIRTTLEWTASRPAVVHGVAAWFESVLDDGIELSNRPGQPELLYGQLFFPCPRPVTVSVGQRIRADLAGGPRAEAYRWRCILDAS